MAVNDIKKSLDTAKIPTQLEPSTLSRFDGKHPVGVTLTTRNGVNFVWDATSPDTFAPFYTTFLSGEPGDVATELRR